MDETVARQVRQYVDALEWSNSHDAHHPQAYEHIELFVKADRRIMEICGIRY